MSEKISSVQNPKVKNVLHLAKASERRDQNLFIAEGYREVNLASEAGYSFKSVFFCPEVGTRAEIHKLIRLLESKTVVYEVTVPVFEKMAYRENSDGIIALAVPRVTKLREIKTGPDPLIVVLERVEKPGNLGAVLRTADASGVDAVLVCDPLTDIYNPNVIRSSIGCIFTTQVVCCTSAEALLWLREQKIKRYAAALTAEKWYHQTDLKGPSAIVMGTEADGLSGFWLQECDSQIKIPMLGNIDSLNVSNATAILVYEAMRQRDFRNMLPQKG